MYGTKHKVMILQCKHCLISFNDTDFVAEDKLQFISEWIKMESQERRWIRKVDTPSQVRDLTTVHA
jgi:hypothetical protein